MRDARYVEIPGTATHELPPLLVHTTGGDSGDTELASMLPEAEEMLGLSDAPEEVVEQRKYDLALSLTEQYRSLVASWLWGDSVVEWIRQCEITFEHEASLRPLLHADVWPHASRASFVTLLGAKGIAAPQTNLESAVGLRLTFRQPPPISCFSNQFLFYLNSVVAEGAYRAWSHLTTQEPALLPPNRFHFEILQLGN